MSDEARTLRLLDGAAYVVASELYYLMEPLVQRSGRGKWKDGSWQHLFDRADVQMLLHVYLAATLEQMYAETNGCFCCAAGSLVRAAAA
jgi:hypothetical protein